MAKVDIFHYEVRHDLLPGVCAQCGQPAEVVTRKTFVVVENNPAPTALLLALPLSAAEPIIVTVEQKGLDLVVQVRRTEYRDVVKTVTVIVNGKPVTQNFTEKVPVAVVRYVTLDGKAGDYFDPAGKRIDPKKLPDVLKKGAVVAVSGDGKAVDPADWAKVLKEKPTVIVSPTGKEVPEEFRKAHKDAAAIIYVQKPK